MQYPNGQDLSFSYGIIQSLNSNKIIHNASTDHGSSGSPIIRRSKDNYIIGLHVGGVMKKDDNHYKFNIATPFDLIINDINDFNDINDNNGIKEPINEINCSYIIKNNEKEIDILHDYTDENNWYYEDAKKVYLEAKELNKKLFEENIELFVNKKKLNLILK